jgi:hypothetical protein
LEIWTSITGPSKAFSASRIATEVCIGRGVDDDRGRLVPRLVDAIHDRALVVRLVEGDREPELVRQRPAVPLHVGQGLVAVDLRLAQAEKIEVRTVEDEDEGHGGSGKAWGMGGRAKA